MLNVLISKCEYFCMTALFKSSGQGNLKEANLLKAHKNSLLIIKYVKALTVSSYIDKEHVLYLFRNVNS